MAQENRDVKAVAEITTRLRRVEGQIRGIQRMIEDERDCEDIITQLMAARAALDKAGLLIVSSHLKQCLRGSSDPELEGSLHRVIELFLKLA
ncbi:MAG: metal-sensitive transcriptional regulator [Anaerolineae bacterium]|nr:metal-sensitive transcriptional regulator [Anaerolineae bacterium]